jgi:hypothetical protein
MAKLDSMGLVGSSGQQYSFRVYVWENKFKPLAAVYVVAERTAEPSQSPRYRPLYVGETEDLSRVFVDHPKDECFQLYYANTIAVLPEPDRATRLRIREDLCSGLAPPCNKDDAVESA